MTNGVLCPIDFSESSKATLQWAVKFSNERGYDLAVLYTYRLKHHPDGDVLRWKKAIEEEAREKFTHLERECLRDTGVAYSFKIEVGFISDRIEAYAARNPIRFLILNKSLCSDKDSFDDLIGSINVPTVIVP